MTTSKSWQQQIGNQRDWIWRGWQTRYTYIRCSQQSTNTPLIFLHGFGACIEHWRNNLAPIAQNYPVYALDLIGFGASRKIAIEYSAYLWAEQVYDFWRTFIDRPVILIGNSIGSLVCMTAAAVYPDMVKGIVMLSLPDISIRTEQVPKIATMLEDALALPIILKTIFKIVRQPKIIRRGLGLAYTDRSAINDELVEIIVAPTKDEGADRAFSALFKSARKPNYAPPAKKVLPDLRIPILLIWGDRDKVVPPTLASLFVRMNSQIKLAEFKNVGHCPHDEVPEVFNQTLLDWLGANFPEQTET